MSNRELFTLGTASQVPTRYRNHNAYFLRWDDEGILFDPGEGAQRQMAMAGLASSSITRICITHFHGDHCLGLAGTIQRLSLDNVPHEVTIHYPASGQVYFDRLRGASIYAGLERVRPAPIAKDGVVCETDAFTLEAMRLDHPVDCYGYRLRERDGRRVVKDLLEARGLSGPAVGDLLRNGRVTHDGNVVRVEDVTEPRRGQVFAFVMDTAPCDAARALAHQADLLVCESTYLAEDAELAERAGHLTATQAAEIARVANARRLVLTHFSRRYTDSSRFTEEARSIHADVVEAMEPTLEDPERARVPVPRR